MFLQTAIEAAECRWSDAVAVNDAIGDLAAQRSQEISLHNPSLARSKLAWKLAVLRQSLTHRLVDLGSAACEEWNQGNNLASVVLARATLETCALVEFIAGRLSEPIEEEDLAAIDDVLMTQTFATRIKSWLDSGDFPQATNILTAISRLDKSLPGASAHYDRMSDISHPNSQGTHQFYSTTDKATATVTFSRTKRSNGEVFGIVLTALGTLPWAALRLKELDGRVAQISEIQHRLTPVR